VLLSPEKRFSINFEAQGMSATTVICFGEVLWDCLPKGLFAGGAPINVAYHLRQFGINSLPLTAVGKDFLGREMLRRFGGWELSAELVSEVDQPTGAVIAELDSAGVASYTFLDDVAWDHIPLTEQIMEQAPSADAIVFGTLAQRSEGNAGGWPSCVMQQAQPRRSMT
jgi:fructokinase